MRADAAKCAMMSICPDAFGAAAVPAVADWANPSKGADAGAGAAEDLAATRAAMTAAACGDKDDAVGALGVAPAVAPAAPPRALRIARAWGFGGACAGLCAARAAAIVAV